jgi:hypothetical protein
MRWGQQVIAVLRPAVELILNCLAGECAFLCICQILRPCVAAIEGQRVAIVLRNRVVLDGG